MSANQSVLLVRKEQLHWLEPGAQEARAIVSDDDRAALLAQLGQRRHRHVFAAPGAAMRLLELAVTREEKRHLASSLPFMLEESLSEDIETLHFARMPLGADRFAVAVVRRDLMAHWSEQLGEFAGLVPWVPEPLLLPWAEGEWTLLVEEDSALLRFGAAQGTRMERALLAPLLAALAAEKPPERVVLYGMDEGSDRALLSVLPDCPVEWRRGGLGTALLLGGTGPTTLDLRQGEFARQLPYARWWRQWRVAAAVLLLAVAVDVLAGWLDYQRLQRENLALRSEVQNIYRRVNPRGAVVDAEKQLRRQLAALRGGAAGNSFVSLLAPLSEAFAGRPGMSLASLTYSQRSAEIRVNLLAPSFDDVEQLRRSLNDAGLNATMESSSRSNDRVRARLRMEAAE